jgi:subtilase family serine protease
MFRSPLKMSAIITALLLVATLSFAASSKKPMLSMGPQAVPTGAVASTVTGASIPIFTCQVGLTPPEVCYDPYQMRTAYGADKLIAQGFDGRGKTIVIVDAFQSPNIVDNLKLFNSMYQLANMNMPGDAVDPNLGTFEVVTPNGLAPTPFNQKSTTQQGWAEEITLDVLWAHAIAPGANITLVLAASSFDSDLLAATKYAVDNRLGDVISQSFGGNESCIDSDTLAAQHQIFVGATEKNITLFASAGDFGSAQISCDGTKLVQAVSSPASDPLVTAVGGTELHAAGYCLAALHCDASQNPAPGTYSDEIVWNESKLFPGGEATGGGISVVSDEPSYQSATVPGKLRGVADVSYNAAVFHGVLTPLIIPGVSNGGVALFGGTSAGSPQWAALTAIADQMAGRSLGYLNTALYHIGHAGPHAAAAFHDIVSGDNSFGGVAGFSAMTGWDPSTGLGSPQSQSVVALLNQFVSAGDGTAAIAGSKPHGNPNAPKNGHMDAH